MAIQTKHLVRPITRPSKTEQRNQQARATCPLVFSIYLDTLVFPSYPTLTLRFSITKLARPFVLHTWAHY